MRTRIVAGVRRYVDRALNVETGVNSYEVVPQTRLVLVMAAVMVRMVRVVYWQQTAMNEMAQRGKKATDASVRAAQQTSTAMQYLQMQQQQLAVSASVAPYEIIL